MKSLKQINLLLAVLLILSLLLGACGGDGSAPAADGTESPGGSGEEAAAMSPPPAGLSTTSVEDTLTVALTFEPGGLDIMQNRDGSSALVVANSSESLFLRNNDTFEYEPWLATSWERIDDLTIRFHLRDDVTFHDGSHFTAEDVLFTLQRGRQLPASEWVYVPFDVSNCKVVDEYTIDIRTLEPFAPFMAYLSDVGFAITSKTAVESVTDEVYNRNPNGASGPYRFVEWIAGDRIVYERNEDYWGEKPQFQYLVYRIMSDSTARTLAFESGDVDICMDPLLSSIDSLKANQNCDVFSCPDFITTNIAFNTAKEPLSSKEVRKALRWALDVDSIANIAFSGTGRTSSSMIPPQLPGWHEPEGELAYGYDPEKAAALLAEAGYPNGFKLNIWCNENQNRIDIAEMLQNAWSGLGIECEVTVMEAATLIDRWSKGEHEVLVMGWNASGLDADFMFNNFHSDFSYINNFSAFKNETYDTLMEQARATLDEEKRTDMYSQVVDLLREELPIISVHNSDTFYGIRSTLTGLELHPQKLPHFWMIKSKAPAS